VTSKDIEEFDRQLAEWLQEEDVVPIHFLNGFISLCHGVIEECDDETGQRVIQHLTRDKEEVDLE